jgi:predicted NAD-dependent protein-ADP-ribosyltransferase YbiA (DUF1768 family)
VLTCGQINDELSPGFTFSPDYYILLGYTGRHYELITYNERGIFSFKELPVKIKEMVVDTCMKRDAGLYSHIEDFKQFAHMEREEGSGKDAHSEEQLHREDIVFQFHLKSNDKHKPGKGPGEKIGRKDQKDFVGLAAIPEWRKKLSNSWYQSFNLDGHRWASVEHYYQGSKFKEGFPTFYTEFSLDSDSDLSKDVVMAKGAGGETGKLKGKLIRPKDVEIDTDFFTERSVREMEAAMYAKFSQNEDLQRLLEKTRTAKLQQSVRAGPAVIFDDLMKVRRRLRREKKD